MTEHADPDIGILPGPGPDAVPAAVYTGRVLALCLVPLALVAGVDYLFLVFPPGREAVTAFAEPGAWSRQRIWFTLAFVCWVLAAWYPPRVLLGRRFHPDLLGTCSCPWFARLLCNWLPRLLALAAGLPIAWQLLQGEETTGLGLGLILLTLAIALGLAFRRGLMARIGADLEGSIGRQLRAWERRPGEQLPHIDGLGGLAILLLGLHLACGALLTWLLTNRLESLARPLGTPALTLYAMAWWSVLLTMLFVYLPKARWHMPALIWLVPLAWLVLAPFNHNHPAAPAPPGPAPAPAPRPGLLAAWQAWERAHPDGPAIVVASAGGASRASYWTTSLLGMLEREATSDPHSLYAHTFLFSAISGGAVGAASFDVAMRSRPGFRDTPECQDARGLARAVPVRDDLATLFGMLLLPDAVAHFLPFPWYAADRSRGLEEAWADDWERASAACRGPAAGAVPPNPWRARFLPVRASPDEDRFPVLLFGTTLLDSGGRAIESRVAMPGVGQADLTDPGQYDAGTLTLAQAVQNSARFPVMTPPGEVRQVPVPSGAPCPAGPRSCPGTGRARLIQVGDGGYVEESGALNLLDALAMLDRALAAADTDGGQRRAAFRSRLRVLVIDPTPSLPQDWLCRPPFDPAGAEVHPPQPAKPLVVLPDLLGPIFGALETRSSRADDARRALLDWTGGCASARFAEIRLPDFGPGRRPALGWLLAPSSLERMDTALDQAGGDPGIATADCARGAQCMLGANLERVRGWLGIARVARVDAGAP